MATLPPLTISPEVLLELSKYATPTGYADYAALAILGGLGATYISRGRLWETRSPESSFV